MSLSILRTNKNNLVPRGYALFLSKSDIYSLQKSNIDIKEGRGPGDEVERKSVFDDRKGMCLTTSFTTINTNSAFVVLLLFFSGHIVI